MNRSPMLFALALMSTSFPALSSTAEPPAASAKPLTIGEALALRSRILGDEREINIYLPSDYEGGAQRYPVLYLIDGGIDQDFLHVSGAVHLGALWARSQSVIVVGIKTVDRRRELVGPTRSGELLKQYPTAGSSALFRRYLREEVMPLVAARYRVTAERGVIGESLAGLFIVETYLREPELFTHYAAISPSLWWDDGRLVKEAAGLLAGRQTVPGRLYLAMADEGPEMKAGMDMLGTALKSQPGWCYSPRMDQTHSTIYHAVSPEALQYIFPDPVKPDPQSGFVVKCANDIR